MLTSGDVVFPLGTFVHSTGTQRAEDLRPDSPGIGWELRSALEGARCHGADRRRDSALPCVGSRGDSCPTRDLLVPCCRSSGFSSALGSSAGTCARENAEFGVYHKGVGSFRT